MFKKQPLLGGFFCYIIAIITGVKPDIITVLGRPESSETFAALLACYNEKYICGISQKYSRYRQQGFALV